MSDTDFDFLVGAAADACVLRRAFGRWNACMTSSFLDMYYSSSPRSRSSASSELSELDIRWASLGELTAAACN